ncbi:ATP-grasp domain-containing protein [Actinomadura litoris]|uniref:ATP-grasp domain-containing protein n=1 Tax=Actinomadura litoris TaxID=2678616 RepID=UPI001FA714BB|nr:ATP-grasp domain-containing protein [Actinomadura litoris]
MSILLLHKKNLSRRRHLARARRYADESGQRLLLIMKDPTWEKDYVDQVVVADTGSMDDTLAAARDLAEPVDAVLTFAEASVPAVARVAAHLGLPAVGERTAFLARDKHAMRTAVGDHAAQPRFALAKDVDEARRAAARIGYPMILKPVIGTGSMYVRSVADEDELVRHFETIRRGSWDSLDYDPLHRGARERYDGALLLEEFLPGTEISVESVVAGGRTTSFAVHDKPLPTGPTFEEVYACTPTRLPAATVERLYAATAAVHAAMGIEVGVTHVEFRLRDGEPVLLEAAARMGGGPIYRSVQLSTGIDMVEAALDLACGRTPVIAPRPEPVAVGFRNIFPDRAGTLTAVRGVEEAKADPRVDEIEIYRKPGEYLKVPPQTFQGHGHLIFTVPSTDHLDGVFEEFRRLVRLEVTE